jgi:hypothetical protein
VVCSVERAAEDAARFRERQRAGGELREAINLLPPAPFAASLLQAPRSAPPGVDNSTIDLSENQQLELERETGIEPATLSLGS